MMLQEIAMRVLCFVFAVSCLAASNDTVFGQSETAQEPSLAKSLVSRYCQAWSTVDPAERKRAVADVWAEHGEYLDSQPVHAKGREGLVAEIVKFQQQFPGARFRCEGVQTHHGFVGYTWSMVMADGTERFKGMDFGELDADGRLVRIVSFFDMPPPAR